MLTTIKKRNYDNATIFNRKQRNENRGGTRENSGAKPKYNEPTKTTSFRIPVSKIEEVKEVVSKMLNEYSKC